MVDDITIRTLYVRELGRTIFGEALQGYPTFMPTNPWRLIEGSPAFDLVEKIRRIDNRNQGEAVQFNICIEAIKTFQIETLGKYF